MARATQRHPGDCGVGDEFPTESFVDRRHGVNALGTLRSLGGRSSPQLHATELRTAAADDLWLSPADERDRLCLGFTWRKHPTQVMALLPDLEAALAPRSHDHPGESCSPSIVTTWPGVAPGCQRSSS
jgi:hypothetical protein